ncbi:hypothetical protein M2480_001351 [Parabacteroides sp. PFB2-12]|nr:hypothetical protein [Parabacteroides sp. PM6-13]MDH6390378.1 hypothetical protein [Parabacteroides sp. PFB2-12]
MTKMQRYYFKNTKCKQKQHFALQYDTLKSVTRGTNFKYPYVFGKIAGRF